MLIHIAGLPLTVHGRTIQRCGICGLKLLDTAENLPVMVGDVIYIPRAWQPGQYVRSRKGKLIPYPGHGAVKPQDFCTKLVEIDHSLQPKDDNGNPQSLTG